MRVRSPGCDQTPIAGHVAQFTGDPGTRASAVAGELSVRIGRSRRRPSPCNTVRAHGILGATVAQEGEGIGEFS